MPRRTAMVVEDNQELARSLVAALERWQFECRWASSLQEAREELEGGFVALALVDIGLPDGSGLDFLGYLRLHSPTTDVIVMTSTSDLVLAARAMSAGAIEFLGKPFELEELGSVIRRWLNRRARESEGEAGLSPEPPERAEGTFIPPAVGPPPLIGRHPSMIALFKRVGLASTGHEPILIEGEPGTGRELVAQTVHRLAHPDQPFLTLDCSALPGHLIEVELFGGATERRDSRPGRLVLASGGTLLIEEIGDMPLAVQARIRDALRDEGPSPVAEEDRGGPLRSRVIFSTRRNLDARVDEGAFDGELWALLQRFRLEVPPLRYRVVDIPDLARDIARRTAHRLGRAGPPAFGAEAIEALRTHPWPGNVRELERAVRRAMSDPETDPITPTALGLAPPPRASMPIDATLDEVIYRHACAVLEDCEGNKREAAGRLDISPGRLYRILDRE